jgi:hypothetical protein
MLLADHGYDADWIKAFARQESCLCNSCGFESHRPRQYPIVFLELNRLSSESIDIHIRAQFCFQVARARTTVPHTTKAAPVARLSWRPSGSSFSNAT